jgi:hypothetical protein
MRYQNLLLGLATILLAVVGCETPTGPADAVPSSSSASISRNAGSDELVRQLPVFRGPNLPPRWSDPRPPKTVPPGSK